ncbi:hypothetical protein BD769DRAFT_1775951 [Suillus cothurnatus]|nr:hypothetical protein BD769DRAFT_1775951 [Suillus cothurnatus]
MSYINPGVYSFVNKDSTGVLSWGNRSKNLVTLRKKSTPWDNTTTLSSSAMAFMELWLVEPLDPSIQPPNNVYTIRNLSSGKYLTSHNGTSVILDNPTSNFTSEGWIITPEPSGYNHISKMQFTKNIGFQNNQVNAILGSGLNERWDLQKVSMSASPDIQQELFKSNIIKANQGLMESQLYLLDSEYLILSQGMLQEIWNGMTKHKYRRDLYDEDDFAIAFKSAVAKWGVRSVLKDVNDSVATNSKNIAFFCAFMVAGPNPNPDPNSVPVPPPTYNFNGYNITLSADSSKKALFFE